MAAPPPERCIPLRAQRAAVKPEFRFSRETTVLFIAATASPNRGKFRLKYIKGYALPGISFFIYRLISHGFSASQATACIAGCCSQRGVL
jgi:hypothetical protein